MFILYYVSHLSYVFYYLDILDVKDNSDFLSELDFFIKNIGIPVTFTLKNVNKFFFNLFENFKLKLRIKKILIRFFNLRFIIFLKYPELFFNLKHKLKFRLK